MKKLISALSSLCLAATSMLGAFAAVPMTASAAEVKADGDIVYDLIPKGKTYTAATGSGNNQYTAEPGETFTIQWTVKNDQKVSGLQMFIDFSDITGNGGKYISSEMGDAYELMPTMNEKNVNTSKADNAKDGGQVFYGFGGNEEYQAADGAVIYEFTVQAPTKEGNYSIVRDTRDKCKVVPLTGSEYSYTMHGLTVKVGNAPEVTTTAKPDEPAQTTTVKQQDPGDPIPSGSIIYDLIPKGKDYTAAPAGQTGNNVYKATAGENITVQWTVKNDQKISGLQMFLDFSDVIDNGGKYVSSEMGDAYELMPTINEKSVNISKAENAKDGGQVFYGFGGNEEFQAADGAVIYEFNIQAPTKDGSYVIVRDTRDKCKVVPLTGNEYQYALRGLEIQVGDVPDDPPAKETTTKEQQTVSGDSIVYNLIPKGKDYTGVADNVTGNNVYKAAPGEKITIQWTVKNDKKVSGLQMFLDFSGVTDNGGKYNSSELGDAYELMPTINENSVNITKAENSKDGGQVFYGFGGNEEYQAADNAVIYEFTITAPEKDGTYSVVQDTRDKCKVVPLVGDPYSFVLHGIDIVVGDAPADETTTTKQQTVSADSIVYNLIPKGKDYTKVADNAAGNNAYNAAPGEEITIQWTVKNDQKVSGLQMFLDFSGITENGGKYNSSEMGDAYELMPTINEKYVSVSKAENAKDGGQVFYGFGGNEEFKAADDAVIYEFTITAPEKDGTYAVVQDTRDKCKVVPLAGDPYDFVLHGLEITVGKVETTTTAAPTPEETTTTENVPAGKTTWTIAKVNAEAGADVKVPVSVEGDEGTGGFVAEFACDKALKINGVEWGKGYTGTATINNNELVVVWAAEDGADQKANGEIMNILVTAPNAAGEYPVTFKSLEVVNTSGNELTVTKTDGAVIVKGEAGSANWIIGEDTVAPGAAATVPVTVKGDTGTSGFVVEFEYDPALTFTGIEWADGYTGEPTKNEASTDEKAVLVVWAEKEGKNIQAADGAVVMNLKFTAPDAAGEYPVTFKNLEVTDTNGTDLTLTKENGKVIVAGSTTTAEPGGNAGWVIGKETVAKGATAKVPVNVIGDPGTAGFVVDFTADPALKFTGFEWGKGYTGDATVNNDELVVVWASEDGQNQKAADDAPILYLIFTAPDAAGEYPVTFENLEAVNRDGSDITIEQTPGAVIVLDETTTTTEVTEAATTTTTEAKADETTTTTAEPDVEESTTTSVTTTAEEPVITTTTETTPIVVPAGEVGWIIGTETVAKGATAKVPVNVKSDPGTAGFIVEFNADPALKFTGFEWGKGYTGDATVNNDELVVVWASEDGTNQKAADDAPVLYLIFTAPDAAGEYPVTFKTLEVSNTDGSFVETVEQPGAVIVIDEVTTTTTEVTDQPDDAETTTTTTAPVVEPGTTTTEAPQPGTTTTAAPQPGTTTTEAPQPGTTTTTAEPQPQGGTTTTTTAAPQPGTTTTTAEPQPQDGTTTTTAEPQPQGGTTTTTAEPQPGTTTTTEVAPPNPGNVVYKIGDVSGQAGTTVKVPVYVYYDEGTAGLTMEFDVPEGCKISGIEYGDAYSKDNNAFTWNADENVLIWTSPDGQNQIAPAGATLVTLLVDVPEDAKEGDVFPITFVKDSVEVSDTERNLLKHTEIDGSVTISKPDPTGDVVFNIGSASGQPGETVDVPLTVSLDKGTTSFSLTLDVPDGTTIDDLKIDPNSPYAQNGKFTWDPETKTLTWTSNDGKPVEVEPGTKIADISVKIPEDAEPGTEIPIKVTNATATDEAGKLMTPTVVPGKVTVTDKDVTTTTAAPIADETTTTTVTGTEPVPDLGTTTTTAEPQPGTTTTTAEPQPGTTTTTAEPQPGTTTTTAEPQPGTTTTTEEPQPGTTTTTAEPQPGTTTTTAEPQPGTTTTTEPLPANVNTVTSIATSFEPPTRVNYWSHDPRSFEESGGLKGLAASIVLTKYYVNDQNQFCDAEGNVIEGAPAYDPTTGAIPEGVTAAETKTLDATAYTHPLEMEDGPKKVWDNETAASLGKTDYTPEEELTAKHANKYPMKAYFHPSEQTDPDFAAINGGEPLYMGDFNIFIGVKGDCTLDNHVKVDDAQNTLVYYTDTLVAHKTGVYICNDPEMGDVDQLRYYLADVDWAEKDEAGVNYLVDADNHPIVKQPTRLDAGDAQFILVHYTNNYVSYKTMTWTDVVGYDLYDSFFGGVKEGEN